MKLSRGKSGAAGVVAETAGRTGRLASLPKALNRFSERSREQPRLFCYPVCNRVGSDADRHSRMWERGHGFPFLLLKLASRGKDGDSFLTEAEDGLISELTAAWSA